MVRVRYDMGISPRHYPPARFPISSRLLLIPDPEYSPAEYSPVQRLYGYGSQGVNNPVTLGVQI